MAPALPAMLGGSSEAQEREAESDGAGALPAPPAIDFPAEGSDPKYDGKRLECCGGPPLTQPLALSGRPGSSEVRPNVWADSSGSGLEQGPSGAVLGAAGRRFG